MVLSVKLRHFNNKLITTPNKYREINIIPIIESMPQPTEDIMTGEGLGKKLKSSKNDKLRRFISLKIK